MHLANYFYKLILFVEVINFPFRLIYIKKCSIVVFVPHLKFAFRSQTLIGFDMKPNINSSIKNNTNKQIIFLINQNHKTNSDILTYSNIIMIKKNEYINNL